MSSGWADGLWCPISGLKVCCGKIMIYGINHDTYAVKSWYICCGKIMIYMLTLNALNQVYKVDQLDQVLSINFLIRNYIATSAFCLFGRSVYLLSFYHMPK